MTPTPLITYRGQGWPMGQGRHGPEAAESRGPPWVPVTKSARGPRALREFLWPRVPEGPRALREFLLLSNVTWHVTWHMGRRVVTVSRGQSAQGPRAAEGRSDVTQRGDPIDRDIGWVNPLRVTVPHQDVIHARMREYYSSPPRNINEVWFSGHFHPKKI